MKILQVNAFESPGSRFHGLAITPLLKKYGVESKHLVWEKDTDNPDVLTFEKNQKRHDFITKIETKFSLQSILYNNASQMMKMQAFKEADLIHLHIIHTGYFSIGDLPKITKSKPTIWTLHDPWALTGHCVHPFGCKRWMIGCGSCPDLNTHIPIRKDTTKWLFKYKRRAYKKSKLNLVVSSKWMHDMVKASPMFEDVPIHQIPFGLDLQFFSPNIFSNFREKYNIPKESLVICFRGDMDNPYKGVSYIVSALERVKTNQPITLLICGFAKNYAALENFANRFQVVNLCWINDQTLMRDAIAASDIFLMPSLAETFGMMSVEAMACGKPVIIFDGTALYDVTHAPSVGISVPSSDADAFYGALQRLIDDPAERIERGRKGREIAELYYNEELHAQNLVKLYKTILENHK